MSLTQTDKAIINRTFNQILTARAGEKFYQHLFAMSPELEPLFHHANMAKQRKMFIDIVRMIVYSLDNLDKITATLHSLGARHHAYGVKQEDYAKVTGAFLSVLKDEMGDAYTEETANAWTAVFQLLESISTENLSK